MGSDGQQKRVAPFEGCWFQRSVEIGGVPTCCLAAPSFPQRGLPQGTRMRHLRPSPGSKRQPGLWLLTLTRWLQDSPADEVNNEPGGPKR